jgi:hypothetical protein
MENNNFGINIYDHDELSSIYDNDDNTSYCTDPFGIDSYDNYNSSWKNPFNLYNNDDLSSTYSNDEIVDVVINYNVENFKLSYKNINKIYDLSLFHNLIIFECSKIKIEQFTNFPNNFTRIKMF